MRGGRVNATRKPPSLRGALATKQSSLRAVGLDCFASLAMTAGLNLRIQPSQNLIELFEVAVLDVHGPARTLVVDLDAEAENVADALFQRQRVGVLDQRAPRIAQLRRGAANLV